MIKHIVFTRFTIIQPFYLQDTSYFHDFEECQNYRLTVADERDDGLVIDEGIDHDHDEEITLVTDDVKTSGNGGMGTGGSEIVSFAFTLNLQILIIIINVFELAKFDTFIQMIHGKHMFAKHCLGPVLFFSLFLFFCFFFWGGAIFLNTVLPK